MKWVEPIARRFAQLTARERGGLAALAALASVFATLSAFEWALDAAQMAQAQRDARVEADAAFRRQTNPTFRERVGLAAGQVWRWSIVEASAGSAQARVVSEIESLASQAGLANVVVEPVSETNETRGRMSAVSVTLTADFSWASFLALLDGISAADASYMIDAVEVSGSSGEGGRVSMRVQAPYLRDGG